MSYARRPPLEAAPSSANPLLSAEVFECFVMPPINSFSNTFVPHFMQKNSHRRRRVISIEVHRVVPKYQSSDIPYEECVLRVLQPVKQRRGGEGDGAGSSASTVGSVFSHRTSGDDDDDSTEAPYPDFIDPASTLRLDEHGREWRPKYRFPIKTIHVKGSRRNSVFIEIDLGKKKRETREIVFENLETSERFQKKIAKEKQNEERRTEEKLKTVLQGTKISLDQNITFLVEIVSGWELPVGDYTTSDPYVVCLLNSKEVHRTDYISRTRDPIWTIATKSLFLLTVNLEDLFRGDGLLCIVSDFDSVGKNVRLGAITVPPKTLFDANGERMEFKLGPPPGKTNDVPGYLALRCRRASPEDIEFMKTLQSSSSSKPALPALENIKTKTSAAIEAGAITQMGGAGNIASLLTRHSRVARFGPNAGQREYKVRPHPDPTRVEETKWMTDEQIQTECWKDSNQWVDAGAGQLGRLYVEIMGCDDLPNLDTGGFAGNKTDAFVCLIFEDAVVQTDIIDDTLAPRWLPWTKRAFIFHIMHPSSQLFLGVFDYDGGFNPTDEHDLVGRVSVDISNLRKDTVYTMKYNIYTSARMSQRKKKGSITIRLRLEIDDERRFLLAAMEPPPHVYVNVKTRKDFQVVKYTCTGKYNMEKYSMKVINSYIEELLALQHVLYYIQDAAMALLLWRGTFPISFGSKTIMFPIHSLLAFVIMTRLVENPEYIPSFILCSIAWILLAAQTYRNSLPDLWSRCKSFREFLLVLLIGCSPVPPDNIQPNENYKEAQEFLASWQKRISDAEAAAEKAYKEQLQAQEDYEREMQEIGDVADVDIATQNNGGVSIDPFKGILFPVQQNLGMVCRYVRHVKHVITWQECYISFWVTFGCIVLSVLFLFVTWSVLILWTARVIVFLVFGPQNKLFDIYYVRKIKPLTKEEEDEKKRRERELRNQRTKIAVSEARIKKERKIKLREMKKQMFGKFIVRVPILKEDRYRDLPLPESTAQPYRPDPRPLSELAMQDAGYKKIRVHGQQLVGDMIPRLAPISFTEAPIGQPTARPRLVDKSRPAGSITPSTDSTIVAYIKFGAFVGLSITLTLYLVPRLGAASLNIHEFLHRQFASEYEKLITKIVEYISHIIVPESEFGEESLITELNVE